jgi:hypothetical protein
MKLKLFDWFKKPQKQIQPVEEVFKDYLKYEIDKNFVLKEFDKEVIDRWLKHLDYAKQSYLKRYEKTDVNWDILDIEYECFISFGKHKFLIRKDGL